MSVSIPSQSEEQTLCDQASGTYAYGPERRWPAHLHLRVDACDKRRVTRLQEAKFHGPLRVQRPFYPEGQPDDGVMPCHLYLLHPPGGLVSGDELRVCVDVEPEAHTLLTTPSATKVYHRDSCGLLAKQKVELNVDDGCCEWLPLDTVIFNGANAELDMLVHLSSKSRYIGWELMSLGLPARGERFLQGTLKQRTALYVDNKMLYHDYLQLAGGDDLLDAMCGFAGQPVYGTLLAYGFRIPLSEVVEQLRERINALIQTASSSPKNYCLVTQRMGVVIVRYLGPSVEQGQEYFRQAWSVMRPLLINLPAQPPRIWAT